MTARPAIGIALGGGAARGWAHIGVLEALRERGVDPRVVSGASIGALVGAALDRHDAERSIPAEPIHAGFSKEGVSAEVFFE